MMYSNGGGGGMGRQGMILQNQKSLVNLINKIVIEWGRDIAKGSIVDENEGRGDSCKEKIRNYIKSTWGCWF